MIWDQFIDQLQSTEEQGTEEQQRIVKQLHDINKHGVYMIVATKESPDCTVSLVINSNNAHVSKKHLTLNDLHEIESNLVLITRQTSKWADAKYLFQEV